jgi:hypothetical protein
MLVSVDILPACDGGTTIGQRLPRNLRLCSRTHECCPTGVEYFYQVGTKGPVRAVTWDSAGRPILSGPAGMDSKQPLEEVTLTLYF